MSYGHSGDGLPEQSSLSDKVILEKSASLLENLATETVIHMLMLQYTKWPRYKREKKNPPYTSTQENHHQYH